MLLDSRIKPWVNKKISEYIGEEEATLTEFICQKVMGRSTAQSILTDVAMVRIYLSLSFVKFLYGFTSLCTVNIINNCSNVWSCFFLQVLDDEAETFVVKMWRLLVYETEAKKAGLV